MGPLLPSDAGALRDPEGEGADGLPREHEAGARRPGRDPSTVSGFRRLKKGCFGTNTIDGGGGGSCKRAAGWLWLDGKLSASPPPKKGPGFNGLQKPPGQDVGEDGGAAGREVVQRPRDDPLGHPSQPMAPHGANEVGVDAAKGDIDPVTSCWRSNPLTGASEFCASPELQKTLE